ncbi:hypothetical protein EI94DRAFT_1783169 [Lactarius quietus]|nr:hypothetical protein EI94DRAFT_1783169 [Lactarius quietus]
MNSPSEAGPSSSGSLTPTLVPSDIPMNHDPDESRALTFRVYKEVWDEFSKWKSENCEQQLLLLQKPLPPPAVVEDALLEASNVHDGEPGEVEIIYLCESDDDIPLNPGGSTVLMCETVHLELPPDFAPHPPYESCTPAAQSIAFRPGSAAEDELDNLPFVPYADDPTFDAKAYLGVFKRFAWEDLGDPDVEVIQFETLRRLYFGQGLSLDEIDVTDVLPPLRSGNREGLIYSLTQRDDLFWPGMMIDFPIDADGAERPGIDIRAYEPGIDDLRKRLNSIVPYFCANPGCVQTFCPRHVWDFPPVPPTAPRVTSDDYLEGESCGTMCFRKSDDTFGTGGVRRVGAARNRRTPVHPRGYTRHSSLWSGNTHEEAMSRGLRSAPTSHPGRQCVPGIGPGSLVHEDNIQPSPCSHTGPCDQNNPDCTCANESVHCSQGCHCGITCPRREGCRCKLNPKLRTKMQRSETCVKCPCRTKGWECDASVCECDNITYLKSPKKWPKNTKPLPRQTAPDGKHYCQNSDIQRGLAAKIEIKRGAFGLGAFAVNRIRQGEFIGEYIGELVPTDSVEKETLRDHVDLNYNFGYSPAHSLDSARVGNETRYINHGSDKDDQSNAEADNKLVLGEQRIGLWANTIVRTYLQCDEG